MGVFDESEWRRTKVSQTGSPVRANRRSWPLSARLLVGAMFVFILLLVAFIVRTEIGRPAAPATTSPLTVEQPKPSPLPELNAPVDSGSSIDQKTPPAEAKPAALPSTQVAKRPANNAQRASRTLLPNYPAPVPRAGVNATQQRLGQTPAPARDAAASPGSSANVSSPGQTATVGASGVPGNAGSAPKAPAPSVLAPSATGQGSTAKGTRPATTNRVAPVGLPPMEKGSAMQKKPVASVASQLEIIHLPAGKSENCGTEDAFLACPTLHTRPETPIPSEEP